MEHAPKRRPASYLPAVKIDYFLPCASCLKPSLCKVGEVNASQVSRYAGLAMVYKCCVPNCCASKKRDEENKENASSISVFRFPSDQTMREKWIKAIPRSHFRPSENHRVCSHHFASSDFVTLTDERENATDATRKRPRLKPSAVPHIFIDCQRILRPRIVQFSSVLDQLGRGCYRIEKFNGTPVEELNEEEVSDCQCCLIFCFAYLQ